MIPFSFVSVQSSLQGRWSRRAGIVDRWRGRRSGKGGDVTVSLRKTG